MINCESNRKKCDRGWHSWLSKWSAICYLNIPLPTAYVIGLYWMEVGFDMPHFRNRCTFLQLFTNSCAELRLSVSNKLFWVCSYLFPCCFSVCGESLSSLRCSPSTRRQLSEMIITQTASALPSQLSAGGWLRPAHRGALAGLPQWPKPTYITRSSTEEIRGPLTYITEW